MKCNHHWIKWGTQKRWRKGHIYHVQHWRCNKCGVSKYIEGTG